MSDPQGKKKDNGPGKKPKTAKHNKQGGNGGPKLSKLERQRQIEFEEAIAFKRWYEPYVDVPFGAICTLILAAVVIIAVGMIQPPEAPAKP